MAGTHQMQGNDHVRWDSYCSSSSCCCICYHSEGRWAGVESPKPQRFISYPTPILLRGFYLHRSMAKQGQYITRTWFEEERSEGSDATHLFFVYVTPHAFFSRNHHVCQGKDICFLRCVWLEEDGSWGCFWHLNISLYLIFIRYELINELDAIPQSWHHRKSKCIYHAFSGNPACSKEITLLWR